MLLVGSLTKLACKQHRCKLLRFLRCLIAIITELVANLTRVLFAIRTFLQKGTQSLYGFPRYRLFLVGRAHHLSLLVDQVDVIMLEDKFLDCSVCRSTLALVRHFQIDLVSVDLMTSIA